MDVNWGAVFGISVPVGMVIGALIGYCKMLIDDSVAASVAFGALLGAFLITLIFLFIWVYRRDRERVRIVSVIVSD